jgi:hypothetical protein
MLDPDHSCLGTAVVDAIVRLGRAQEKLKTILENHLAQRYSKHDPEWESEYERESNLLYEARCKLNTLHDSLWDLMGVLQPEGE